MSAVIYCLFRLSVLVLKFISKTMKSETMNEAIGIIFSIDVLDRRKKLSPVSLLNIIFSKNRNREIYSIFFQASNIFCVKKIGHKKVVINIFKPYKLAVITVT